MAIWVWLAVAAAFFQNLRFMLQRQLAVGGMSAVGATYARFVFSAPIVLVAVLIGLGTVGVNWPEMTPRFWMFGALGGICQIIATILVVSLFKLRNFAVGVTLKKVETLLTVFVGMLILGDAASSAAIIAIVIGVIGVVLLSDPPNFDANIPLWKRILNKASGIGIASGVFFALSAVFYRGATLALAVDGFVLRAGVTLAIVGLIQTSVLTIFIAMKERQTFVVVAQNWSKILPLGLLSAAGSWCWFAAFSMSNAGYVFAVGQIEVIFSAIASVLVFHEKISPREGLGIFLVVVSIVFLVLIT